MKNIIITRADSNVQEMCQLTHPYIKKYADKCNADFKIITDATIHPASHYRILQCYQLLGRYDRILHIDTDIIIKKSMPDLFNIVPENMIGTLLEDKGSRQEHRRNLMKEIQLQRENIGWGHEYINTGMFLVSKMHKEIFNLDINNVWRGFGEDDLELGYQIHKHKFEIFELPPEFNFMSMFEEPWYGKNRLIDGKILHFAGKGFTPFLKNIEQIKQDLSLLKRFDEV